MLDLDNYDEVKKYLFKQLKYKKPKKHNSFYVNLCKMYNIYPEMIEEIVENLSKLGYYKDYFHVLCFSRNDKLNDYIYELIVYKYYADLQAESAGRSFTKLIKWLPRENSSIDKKTNFVENFCNIILPDSDLNASKRLYRKTNARINKLLKTSEIYLSKKEYDKIIPNNTQNSFWKFNKNTILKNDNLKDKYYQYLKNEYNNKKLSSIIYHIMNNKMEEIEKNILQDSFENNIENYWKQFDFIDQYIENCTLYIDLSSSVFDNNYIYLILSICILANKLGKNIIIKPLNGDFSEIEFEADANLENNVETILEDIGSFELPDELDINSENVLFVTNKNIVDDYLCSLKANKILYWKLSNEKIFVEQNNDNNIVKICGTIDVKSKNRNEEILDSIFSKYDKQYIRDSNSGCYWFLLIVFIVILSRCFIYYSS